MKSELVHLLKKLSKPLAGLTIIGVSTTLAACYGPPPRNHDDVASADYCEAMLQKSCGDETISMPETCPIVSPEEKAKVCQGIVKDPPAENK